MLLQELARMRPEKKQEAIADLVKQSRGPANGQVSWLDHELSVYEAQYKMTTAQMKAAFKRGEIGDTPDVARWLVLSRERG